MPYVAEDLSPTGFEEGKWGWIDIDAREPLLK